MKNLKFITLTLTIVGAFSAGYFYNNTDAEKQNPESEKEQQTESVKENKTSDNIFSKILSTRASSSAKVHPITMTPLIQKYGGQEFKNYLEKVSAFEVDQKSPNSKIVKDVSLAQLDLGNHFMSLAAFTESYNKTAYPDNMGVATGFGYNISMQTKGLNKAVFESVQMPTAVNVSQIMSGRMNFSSFPSEQIQAVSLNAQRAVQVTEIMKKEFESHIPSIIGSAAMNNAKARAYMKENSMTAEQFGKHVLDNLEPNKKDVIIYNVYKVGPAGFAKYKSLLNSLVTYHFDKTEKNADKVASSFTYNYSIGGVVKQDTRASALITTMWNSPNDFKEVVNKAGIYPDRILKRVQSIHEGNNLFNSDGTPNDDFGQLKRDGQIIKFMGQKYSVGEVKSSMGAFMGG